MALAANLEIAGRYRVLRSIARGGMGEVYEVEHLHTGQRLALKVLLATTTSPESIERFKREARAASRIKSEHVVRVTDADGAPELDGAPFLVMELLDGKDLGALTNGRSASRLDVVEWLRQASRALERAHEVGIIHRDLKPENLFLTHRDDGSPLVKILDFGVAKFAEDASTGTRSGQIVGTPLFMAPEQALGALGKTTPRTDLFSMGLIAYALLTGENYWGEGNMANVVRQLLYEPMKPPSSRHPDLGTAFDEWFAKACARDAEGRFPSASAQVVALAHALGVPLARDSADMTLPPNAPQLLPESILVARAARAAAPTLEAASASLASAVAPRKKPRWPAFAVAGACAAIGVVVLVMRFSSNVDRKPTPSSTHAAAHHNNVAPQVQATPTIDTTSVTAPAPSPLASTIASSSSSSPPAPPTIAKTHPLILTKPHPSSTPPSTSPTLDPLADQK